MKIKKENYSNFLHKSELKLSPELNISYRYLKSTLSEFSTSVQNKLFNVRRKIKETRAKKITK